MHLQLVPVQCSGIAGAVTRSLYIAATNSTRSSRPFMKQGQKNYLRCVGEGGVWLSLCITWHLLINYVTKSASTFCVYVFSPYLKS